jgi:hypothetical protein
VRWEIQRLEKNIGRLACGRAFTELHLVENHTNEIPGTPDTQDVFDEIIAGCRSVSRYDTPIAPSSLEDTLRNNQMLTVASRCDIGIRSPYTYPDRSSLSASPISFEQSTVARTSSPLDTGSNTPSVLMSTLGNNRGLTPMSTPNTMLARGLSGRSDSSVRLTREHLISPLKNLRSARPLAMGHQPLHSEERRSTSRVSSRRASSISSGSADAQVPEIPNKQSNASVPTFSMVALQQISSVQPQPDKVLSFFKGQAVGDEETTSLLCRLSYAVASPASFEYLSEALGTARKGVSLLSITESQDPASFVRTLDRLEGLSCWSTLMRRYYLVKFSQQKTILEQRCKIARNHPKRSVRRLKYDVANIELLNLPDKSSSRGYLDRGVTGKEKGRANSRALADLMAGIYPDLREIPLGQQSSGTQQYQKMLRKLKSRLSNARNWLYFAEEFSTGVLSLIPSGGPFKIAID